MEIAEASNPPKLPTLSKYGNRIGRPPFWTVAKVKPALIKARGIPVRAAKILAETYGRSCSRNTVTDLMRANPELQDLSNSIRESLLDLCEEGVFIRAEVGEQKDQHFLLRHHGKNRGYSTRQELTGPNGTPLGQPAPEPGMSPDEIKQLSDDELQALIAGEKVKKAIADRALAKKIAQSEQEPANV